MKIGLIGCGKQAPKHISGLKIDGDVEIVVCDIDSERAKSVADAHDVDWRATADDIFSDPEIVAVDVATPTPSHAELVGKAIDANKHFFCEKPFCEALADAEAMAAAMAEKALVGMVGYVYRHSPVFKVGHQLTAGAPPSGGELGQPTSAFFRIGGRGEHELWKHRKQTSGGAISEMLVHMLDLAIWYFDMPAQAELVSELLVRPTRTIQGTVVDVDAEDYVLTKFTGGSNLPVVIQADLLTPAFSQYVEIQFEHGSFWGSIQADRPSFVFSTRDTATYEAGKTVLDFGSINLFESQMTYFLDHVRRSEPVAINSVDDTLKLMQSMKMLKGE